MEVDSNPPVAESAAAGSPAAAAAQSGAANPSLHLDILSTVKTSQSQNGLRHKDYLRYRKYCARKLKNLRSALKFTHGRKQFQKRTLKPEIVTNDRFLSIPLVNAERCWSYAMELKEQYSKDNTRVKFHLIKRLVKAAQWSAELESLCAARADSRTQLESSAYSAWMHANMLIELNKFQEASQKFTLAKNVFEKIAQISDLQHAALCEERIRDIDTGLRLCEYRIRQQRQLGGEAASDSAMLLAGSNDELLAAKMQEALVEKRHQHAKDLERVEWQGVTLEVHNEKLRLFLIEAQEAALELKQAQESASSGSESAAAAAAPLASQSAVVSESLFNSVNSSYEEAMRVIRDELKQLGDAGIKGERLQAQQANLLALRDYCQYNKLQATMARNLQLVAQMSAWLRLPEIEKQAAKLSDSAAVKKCRPSDVVVVFDKLLVNVTETAELGKAAQNPQLAAVLNAKTAFFRAFRSFYVAESFKRFGKWLEATALYRNCVTLCKVASELAGTPGLEQSLVSSLAFYTREAETQGALAHGNALIEQQKLLSGESVKQKLSISPAGESEESSIVPLIDRLDKPDSVSAAQASVLVEFPPDFQIAPCKPAVFDLAFNAVQYDSLTHRLKVQPKPAKGQGLLGRVGNLLWGGAAKQ